MTKYRLKDQELQKKLDGLTKGAFSKWLLEQADINGFGDGTTYGVKLGEAIELGVLVRSEAVEVIHEYDPNDWNKFPEVTPPENTWMRVIQCTHGWTRFTSAFYRDGKWYQELEIDGQLFRKPILGVWKFRPWE